MNLLDIDLNGILSLSVSPLQLMLRGTLMYWFLFAIFRSCCDAMRARSASAIFSLW